jgi:hypothetical protein
MIPEGARFDAGRDQPRHGADGIKEDLARQLTLMANRALPYRRLTAAVLRLLDHPVYGPPLAANMRRAWRRRMFRTFYERPLLLFAGLRADALADGAGHPLHAALRDDAPDPAVITDATVRSALDTARTGLWTSLGLRRVQTNETSRALAWLWPAGIAGCSGGARPLVLVDVGCSAGLNLVGDRLPAPWTIAGSVPLPVVHEPVVVARLGLDERPLDALREEDAWWLRACVWPGETDRLRRLDSAVATFSALRGTPDAVEIVRRDCIGASACVRGALGKAPQGTLAIVYQTMMSGYLDAATRAAFENSLEQLVTTSPPRSVLWVDLEVTGSPTSPKPAEMWVHARDRDRVVRLLLGTMGYHPTDVAVREDGVRELARLFA